MKGVGLLGLHCAVWHGDIGAFMLCVVVCINEFIICLFKHLSAEFDYQLITGNLKLWPLIILFILQKLKQPYPLS